MHCSTIKFLVCLIKNDSYYSQLWVTIGYSDRKLFPAAARSAGPIPMPLFILFTFCLALHNFFPDRPTEAIKRLNISFYYGDLHDL